MSLHFSHLDCNWNSVTFTRICNSAKQAKLVYKQRVKQVKLKWSTTIHIIEDRLKHWSLNVSLHSCPFFMSTVFSVLFECESVLVINWPRSQQSVGQCVICNCRIAAHNANHQPTTCLTTSLSVSSISWRFSAINRLVKHVTLINKHQNAISSFWSLKNHSTVLQTETYTHISLHRT